MPPFLSRVILTRLINIVSAIITAVAIYKIKDKLDRRKYGK